MQPKWENHKIITTAALSFIVLSIFLELPVSATAALDNDLTEAGTIPIAPSTVPIVEPPSGSESSEDSVSAPESKEPLGAAAASSSPPFQTDRAAIAPGSGQPIYSIRLPLGVAGSVLPRLESGKPALPPPGSVLPKQRAAYSNNGTELQEFSRPVAWRATAEAIRTQAASSSMQVATIASDFKTTYTTIFREAPAAGWSLASLSLPAGHFLLRIPKSNDGDSSEDAAAWLVVLLSPIDSSSTEMRVKIQSRRASNYVPAVSNFIKRCQMKATGNELL